MCVGGWRACAEEREREREREEEEEEEREREDKVLVKYSSAKVHAVFALVAKLLIKRHVFFLAVQANFVTVQIDSKQSERFNQPEAKRQERRENVRLQ